MSGFVDSEAEVSGTSSEEERGGSESEEHEVVYEDIEDRSARIVDHLLIDRERAIADDKATMQRAQVVQARLEKVSKEGT
jgi:hypothetical protein